PLRARAPRPPLVPNRQIGDSQRAIPNFAISFPTAVRGQQHRRRLDPVAANFHHGFVHGLSATVRVRGYDWNLSHSKTSVAATRAFDTLNHCASRDARWSTVRMEP